MYELLDTPDNMRYTEGDARFLAGMLKAEAELSISEPTEFTFLDVTLGGIRAGQDVVRDLGIPNAGF